MALPTTAHLGLFIPPVVVLKQVPDVRAHNLLHFLPDVGVESRSKDNQIRVEGAPIGEFQTGRCKGLYVSLLRLDLAVDDLLRAADVEVVPSRTLVDLEDLGELGLEAHLSEAVKRLRVLGVQGLEDRRGHDPENGEWQPPLRAIRHFYV